MNTVTNTQALEWLTAGDVYQPTFTLTPLTPAGSPLTVLAADLALDESGEDYMTLTVTIQGEAPSDMINAPEYRFTAGAVFLERNATAPTMLDIRLVGRKEVIHADGTAELTFKSFESLVQDYGLENSLTDLTAPSYLHSQVTSLIHRALPSAQVVTNVGNPVFIQGSDTYHFENYAPLWGIIQEWCDQAAYGDGVTCYWDGSKFVLDAMPHAAQETPSLVIPAHFLTDITVTKDRENFANFCVTRYTRVPEGTTIPPREFHFSYGTGKAHSLANTKRKIYLEQIDRMPNISAALTYVSHVIRRKVEAGSLLECTAARLYLTLRPYDTVTVEWAGHAYRGVIQNIAFSFTKAETSLSLKFVEQDY